jgi:putative hydrolase of the HAD superfamily
MAERLERARPSEADGKAAGRSGVVFDLDETLIDRHASMLRYADRFWSDFQSEIPVPRPEFLERFLELDGNGYVDRKRFFQALAEYLGRPKPRPEAIASHFGEFAWNRPVLMEGAVDGCRRLRAGGVPVGIVTNGGSRNQRKKLRNTGLDELVDCVIISEEFGAKKPDASIFLEAARQLGIDPEASWFVGDNPMLDILGAGRTGFRTIWLRRSIRWPADQAPCYTRVASDLMGAFREVHDDQPP